MIRLALDESSLDEIRGHLQNCDDRFRPPLSTRVDIAEYAAKIRTRATTFEAWDAQRLIALIAVYRDVPERSAFITSVSVLAEYEGQGLATRLLRRAMQHLERARVEVVSLEAAAASAPSLRLYEQFGFATVEERGDFRLMRASLPGRMAFAPEG